MDTINSVRFNSWHHHPLPKMNHIRCETSFLYPFSSVQLLSIVLFVLQLNLINRIGSSAIYICYLIKYRDLCKNVLTYKIINILMMYGLECRMEMLMTLELNKSKCIESNYFTSYIR